MKKGKQVLIVLLYGLILLVALGADGVCDPVVLIDPPFDATGDYEGEWWVGASQRCPITANFLMDPEPAETPLWKPYADFTIDFSCFDLPVWIPSLEPVDIQARGELDDLGNLTFASLDCGVLPFCVQFTTDGLGEDSDGNGMMDFYSGDWNLTLSLTGFPPYALAGEFDLDRVAP